MQAQFSSACAAPAMSCLADNFDIQLAWIGAQLSSADQNAELNRRFLLRPVSIELWAYDRLDLRSL
jgi:hypothetical protein